MRDRRLLEYSKLQEMEHRAEEHRIQAVEREDLHSLSNQEKQSRRLSIQFRLAEARRHKALEEGEEMMQKDLQRTTALLEAEDRKALMEVAKAEEQAKRASLLCRAVEARRLMLLKEGEKEDLSPTPKSSPSVNTEFDQHESRRTSVLQELKDNAEMLKILQDE